MSSKVQKKFMKSTEEVQSNIPKTILIINNLYIKVQKDMKFLEIRGA